MPWKKCSEEEAQNLLCYKGEEDTTTSMNLTLVKKTIQSKIVRI